MNLQVFDRWGGLMYASDEANSSWDGTKQGKPLPRGTYVLLLSYRNLLSGEVGQLTQEVVLLK